MSVLSRRTSNFDFIAEIAARACGARGALVVKRTFDGPTAEIVGRFGSVLTENRVPILSAVEPEDHYFRFFSNIQTDERFADHPIIKVRPRIDSMLVASLGFADEARESVYMLAVVNITRAFIDNDDAFAVLARMVESFRSIVSSGQHTFEPPSPSGLNEQGAEHHQPMSLPVADNPAHDFLLETLSRRQTLHNRNDATYLALRAWRKTIREHQIAAVAASKKAPTERFINTVAQEMAEAAVRVFGRQTIKCVVPVPGGSSVASQGELLMEGVFRPPSFSELLAKRIAEIMGVPFVEALQPQMVAKGRSHPKKAARLTPYDLAANLEGTVLLIDDIATSGRHLELAQMAIRRSGQDCFAMSWIGP